MFIKIQIYLKVFIEGLPKIQSNINVFIYIAMFKYLIFGRTFQITISYVDEDLPFEERQASLADYGFRCKCPKCIEEEP